MRDTIYERADSASSGLYESKQSFRHFALSFGLSVAAEEPSILAAQLTVELLFSELLLTFFLFQCEDKFFKKARPQLLVISAYVVLRPLRFELRIP